MTSLTKANRHLPLVDKILLMRRSVFNGSAASLAISGSGTAENPIVVGACGDGNRPQLNGAGELENLISPSEQEYIEISGLEITNLDEKFNSSFGLNSNNNTQKNLRAVNVTAEDFGVVHGIALTDLFIHSVNGNLGAKWNDGIFFSVGATVNNGELLGVPTKYDQVLIAGNKIEKVDRSGIELVSSEWSKKSLGNSPSAPRNWFPSTHVVVRDNQNRHVGGDAITVHDTDGVQHGQGLDTDHVSSYSVMQYNYTHNNEGGFMLIMN